MLSSRVSDAWSLAVQESYRLKKHVIFGIDCFETKNLFGETYFSNAPFLTDGYGLSNCTMDDVEEIRNFVSSVKYRYFLIKSRSVDLSMLDEIFRTDYSFVSFVLDLTGGIDHVWNRSLTAKTRNQTRKGLKAGVIVKQGGEELLSDFYTVISLAWRDLGTPTHSLLFYKNLARFLGDKLCFFVSYLSGEPVSAALCIISNNTICHPFAATVRSQKSSSVNNVLYWEIIKYACENRIDSFDLGRSHLNQGTYRYKLSWGATPVPLYYSYLFAQDGMEIPRLDTRFLNYSTSIWKKVPLRIANRLGPRLISKVL